MDENLVSIIWSELKRYTNTVDRAEAAESLVSILIDNDSDPADIKDAFAGDAEIKRALADYINKTDDVEEYDEEEENDEDEDYDDWD